jgi:mannose-6-phosphate isomerase
MTIILKPIPQNKIWGGDKLSKYYGFSKSNIGEIWGISAHISNSNIITNGSYKGMTFREFYNKHRNYFGNLSNEEFPLLFKIIDAKHDLSVQVHPNDKYALINENSYGKDECWYILEADKNTKIQIGHKFKSKEDLLISLKNNTLEKKLNYQNIIAGEYFYIKSGTVHAICKNTTLLEVSQSSDITYRIYDYDRLEKGKPRKLNIEKSIDVMRFPDPYSFSKNDNNLFKFKILETKKKKKMISHLYGDYIYFIEGDGYLDEIKIKKGDFVVITSKSKYTIEGVFKFALIQII